MSETPKSQFIGTWELKDRGLLEGVEIKITEDEKGNFTGTITKLNDNKYVLLFMEIGDKLLSGIDRNSNFEFVISEKKIAAPLFSHYGQSTTQQFQATFNGKNEVQLGKSGAEGSYVRVD